MYGDMEHWSNRDLEEDWDSDWEQIVAGDVADYIEDFVQALPVVSAEKILEGENCTICLDAFASSKETAVILICGHQIGRDCLLEWLIQNNHTCPLCRAVVYRGNQLDEIFRFSARVAEQRNRYEAILNHQRLPSLPTQQEQLFIPDMFQRQREREAFLRTGSYRQSAHALGSSTTGLGPPTQVEEQRSSLDESYMRSTRVLNFATNGELPTTQEEEQGPNPGESHMWSPTLVLLPVPRQALNSETNEELPTTQEEEQGSNPGESHIWSRQALDFATNEGLPTTQEEEQGSNLGEGHVRSRQDLRDLYGPITEEEEEELISHLL